MLTEYQAELLTEQAVHAANEFADLLTRLHDGEAHKALGYTSWASYCADNFDASLRSIYRYIRQERARQALADCAIVARFDNGALEALGEPTDAEIQALADIAAKTVDGRIGAGVVRSVQAAVAETLVTGAVEGADGEQFRVSDVMVAGVREYQREEVLKKREYIVANGKAEVFERGYCAVKVYISIDDKLPLQTGDTVRISIWRELP